jgi:hypothetical protein
MSRVCLALMVLVLCAAGVALAQEPAMGYPQNGDPWNYVPQPSGMQFDGTDWYGGGGCPCDGTSPCVHWTQVSWYATWPNYGWPPIHHHKHGCKECYGY